MEKITYGTGHAKIEEIIEKGESEEVVEQENEINLDTNQEEQNG